MRIAIIIIYPYVCLCAYLCIIMTTGHSSFDGISGNERTCNEDEEISKIRKKIPSFISHTTENSGQRQSESRTNANKQPTAPCFLVLKRY